MIKQSSQKVRYIPKNNIKTTTQKPKKSKYKQKKKKLHVDLDNNMFMKYNHIHTFRTDNYDSVDGKYDPLLEYYGKGIDEYVESMPFDRQEIYDFYTKFKALSKLCVDNMRSRRDKREIYSRKKRQVDFVDKMSKTKGSFGNSRGKSDEFDDQRVFTPKL